MGYWRTDDFLSDVYFPFDAIMCTVIYDNVAGAVYEASGQLLTYSNKTHNIKPRQNKYVAGHHAEAKKVYMTWVQDGRHREGPELEHNDVCKHK